MANRKAAKPASPRLSHGRAAARSPPSTSIALPAQNASAAANCNASTTHNAARCSATERMARVSKGVSMAGSTRNGAIDIVPPTANAEPAKPRQLLRTAIESHSAMPSA
ncbi:hypothetical protein D9M68_1001160 [compost metagenome]